MDKFLSGKTRKNLLDYMFRFLKFDFLLKIVFKSKKKKLVEAFVNMNAYKSLAKYKEKITQTQVHYYIRFDALLELIRKFYKEVLDYELREELETKLPEAIDDKQVNKPRSYITLNDSSVADLFIKWRCEKSKPLNFSEKFYFDSKLSSIEESASLSILKLKSCIYNKINSIDYSGYQEEYHSIFFKSILNTLPLLTDIDSLVLSKLKVINNENNNKNENNEILPLLNKIIHKLNNINLSSNDLGNHFFNKLNIPEENCIINLNLSSNKITNDILKNLLKNLKFITDIDLQQNNLKEGCGIILKQHLVNKVFNMNSIHLDYNELKDNDAKELAEAIGLRKLSKLSLSQNFIQTEGAKILILKCDELGENNILSELNINENRFNKTVLTVAYKYLKKFYTNSISHLYIRRIDIVGNYISKVLSMKFYELFRANIFIKTLDIANWTENNNITEIDILIIKRDKELEEIKKDINKYLTMKKDKLEKIIKSSEKDKIKKLLIKNENEITIENIVSSLEERLEFLEPKIQHNSRIKFNFLIK